jgi:serine protease
MAAFGGDMAHAPLDGILSTSNDGSRAPGSDTYTYAQGTSMAGAQVSGVAALMISRDPTITPNRVLDRMRVNATVFPDFTYPYDPCGIYGVYSCGAGILNAYWSVAMANAPAVYEIEPNDTVWTAQPISLPMAVVSSDGRWSDSNDYYKVTLDPGRRLRASAVPKGTAGSLRLSLLDRVGKVLNYVSRGGGQTVRVVYDNVGPSKVNLYLKVDFWDGAYSLSIAH